MSSIDPLLSDMRPGVVGALTVDAYTAAPLSDRLADAATKGVAGAVVSGFTSIANTFLTEDSEYHTEDVLRNLGLAGSADYYVENREIVDLAGFALGSIPTYGLGVGALRLARAGFAGGPMARALNFLPNANRTQVRKAIDALAQPGGAMADQIRKSTWQRLAAATGDNILAAAAGETATALLMFDSPTMENYSAKDWAVNVFGFGALGGVFEFLSGAAAIKKVALAVDAQTRNADTMGSRAIFDLKKQNEISSWIDQIMDLDASAKGVEVNYTYAGEKNSFSLLTGERNRKARDTAIRSGVDQVRLLFNDLASSNVNVGQALAEFMETKLANIPTSEIGRQQLKDELVNFMAPIRKLQPNTKLGEITPNEEARFMQLRGLPNAKGSLLNETFMPKQTHKVPVRFIGDATEGDLKISDWNRSKSAQEAFEAGYDVYYARNGVPSINPRSPRIQKTQTELTSNQRVIDVETGTWGVDPVRTVGDLIVNPKNDVRLTPRGVTIAGEEFPQSLVSGKMGVETDTMTATARWVWASKLEPQDIIRMTKQNPVHAQDLPLMARVAELRESLPVDLRIVDDFDNEFALGDLADMPKMVRNQRLAWLAEHFDTVGPSDTRELAAALNTSRKWVEDAIANSFQAADGMGAGERATAASVRPRTVVTVLDDQQQFWRGTDGKGNEFDGWLVKVSKTPLQYDELAATMGIKVYKDGKDAVPDFPNASPEQAAAIARKEGIMLRDFDVSTKAPLPTPGGKPTPAGVIAKSPVSAEAKRITGLGWGDIVAHELGHALDYFFAATYGDLAKLHSSIDLNTPTWATNQALMQEFRQTSLAFRPRQWITQPTYVKTGQELLADNFAKWMTDPGYRSNMPMFAAMFAQKLEPYEQYFRKRIWERVNGPHVGKDALLAHNRELMIAKQRAEGAVAQVLARDADLLVDAQGLTARKADSGGAGASVLGAADANYGDKLKSFVNYTGRIVSNIKAKRIDEVLGVMKSHFERIAATPAAAAELSMVTTKLRRTSSEHKWHILRVGDDKDMQRFIVTDEVRTSYEASVETGTTIQSIIAKIEAEGREAKMPVTSPAVLEFMETYQKLNSRARQDKALLMNAKGMQVAESTELYAPPVDTVRYPHVAFVVPKDRVGSRSEITMITAKDADQLRVLMGKVPEQYSVLTKDNTDAFFKAKGQYEYQHTVSESTVDGALKRNGVLGDFFPETRAENVLTDYSNFLARQQTALVRHAVELKYGELFSDLRFLSDQYTRADRTVAKGILQTKAQKISDPFGDYIRTALDMSKQEEFPLLDSLNEFVDRIGRKAWEVADGAFNDAKQGLVSWEDANKMAKEYGLPTPFTGWEDYLAANIKMPRNLIAEWTAKGNHLLATFGLRLDAINSLVNALSMPIMAGMEVASIRAMLGKDEQLLGEFNALTKVADPASGMQLPSTSKLLASAMKAYFDDLPSGKLHEKYRVIAGMSQMFEDSRSMLDDIAPKLNQPASKMMERMDAWTEKASRWTLGQRSEEFARFAAANIMDQMTAPLVRAGKMNEREANMYITSFVNRVQGNYLASQRPALFQGTAGRTISLFQTYMFNVFQQLTRHVQDRNTAALVTFTALQTSVYGLNGLPYFDAVNTYLAGKMNNPEKKDAYSLLPEMMGRYGEWMLYGTPSAFPLFDGKGPALYSRGDLSPRTLIGLPTSPADIPVVSAASKLVGAVTGFFKQMGQGSDLSDAMLHALEHQGISRPLAGFAQTLAGRATTSSGSLVSASQDLYELSTLGWMQERIVNFGGMTRVLGAKPLDDAIIMDAYYKNKKLQLQDRERLEDFGTTVKQKLYANQVPDDEELLTMMEQYAARGGTQENFTRALQQWSRDANVGVVNAMAGKLDSPYAKRLQVMMGGERQPDFYGQSPDSIADGSQ